MDILEYGGTEMIKELYKKAGELHGHYCPGLAIGVRAATEALEILKPSKKAHNLCCIAENRACYLDGIQMIFGTTMGNGNIELRETGKTAFNFYDRATGRSVRLVAKVWPENLSRDELTDYILTAPLEAVFDQTEVHFEAPADTFKRHKSIVCPRCGEACTEPFLRVVDGVVVCLDCASRV